MKNFYLCWVDDVEGAIASYNGSIQVLEHDHPVKFTVDEHTKTADFDTIAKALTEDSDLIFLVDYNLKENNGNGMEGDEVIKMIRDYNKKCLIVFYSSKASQEELRNLVDGLPNIVCVLRESLKEVLADIATGDILKKLQ